MSDRDFVRKGFQAARRRYLAGRMLAEFQTALGIRGLPGLKPISVRADAKGTRLVYLTATADGAFILKMHTAAPERNPIGREYDITRRVSAHFASIPGFSVPEPVFRSACGRCFAMPYFEGQTARRVLLDQSGADERRAVFRRAGRWLRVLHDVEPLASGDFRTGWIFSTLQRASAQPPADFPATTETEAIGHFTASLRGMAASVHGTKVRTAFSHGDFSANNLMLGGPETCGIDFGFAKRRNAVADISDFLVYDLMFEADGAELAENGIRTDHFSAFRDGYGEIEDADALCFLLRAKIVRKWLSLRRVRRRTHPDYGFRQKEARRRLELLFPR